MNEAEFQFRKIPLSCSQDAASVLFPLRKGGWLFALPLEQGHEQSMPKRGLRQPSVSVQPVFTARQENAPVWRTDARPFRPVNQLDLVGPRRSAHASPSPSPPCGGRPAASPPCPGQRPNAGFTPAGSNQQNHGHLQRRCVMRARQTTPYEHLRWREPMTQRN